MNLLNFEDKHEVNCKHFFIKIQLCLKLKSSLVLSCSKRFINWINWINNKNFTSTFNNSCHFYKYKNHWIPVQMQLVLPYDSVFYSYLKYFMKQPYWNNNHIKFWLLPGKSSNYFFVFTHLIFKASIQNRLYLLSYLIGKINWNLNSKSWGN